MLSPEALRLVVVEILRPTAAVASSGSFPTVAGGRVYDSREIPVQDIDREQAFTPVISVHSNDARIISRGEMTDFSDVEQQAVLDIIAELAIVAEDDNGEFADAMAGNDPQARLILAALCAKIRFLMEFSEKGAPWRKLVKRIVSLEELPFAVPDIGLRFQRMTLRYTVELQADVFDVENGALPEPMKSVFEALPVNSYARAKLAQLAGYFQAESYNDLQTIAGQAELPGGEELTIGSDGLSV